MVQHQKWTLVFNCPVEKINPDSSSLLSYRVLGEVFGVWAPPACMLNQKAVWNPFVAILAQVMIGPLALVA